jgi:L-fuconolactonase
VRIGRRLTSDAWYYHYQNRDFLDLARSAPDTTIVLDIADIADIAQCLNVVAKIGGLALPDNGFGWHVADRPERDPHPKLSPHFNENCLFGYRPATRLVQANFCFAAQTIRGC